MEGERRFSIDKAASGFYLVVWGFFKKLVIADNVGVIANKVFALNDPAFEILWAGVFAFAIQIYADFSAYTDIARGTSRWLGFELTQNFEHPYLARNPADFWRRWNISLSSWFRDYVYIPLGGSRGGELTWARNIMVTFLLSGLWHGAQLELRLVGALSRRAAGTRAEGTFEVPRNTQPRTSNLGPRSLLQIPAMFLLTLLGWLLFRETELSAIVRDLKLSPFNSSPFDRQAGLYLFLLAFGYSIPLWVQSVWVELHRGQPTREPGWGGTALRVVACGAAFARHPRATKPHVAGLYLLPVLSEEPLPSRQRGRRAEQRAERDAVGGVLGQRHPVEHGGTGDRDDAENDEHRRRWRRNQSGKGKQSAQRSRSS